MEPPFGCSPVGAAADPWRPQPKDWRDLTVSASSGHPDSMLTLYRDALRVRRSSPELGDGSMTWQPTAHGVPAAGYDRVARKAGTVLFLRAARPLDVLSRATRPEFS